MMILGYLGNDASGIFGFGERADCCFIRKILVQIRIYGIRLHNVKEAKMRKTVW
jgi:hypothetical protein